MENNITLLNIAILLAGGPAEVARRCERTKACVTKWKSRGLPRYEARRKEYADIIEQMQREKNLPQRHIVTSDELLG